MPGNVGEILAQVDESDPPGAFSMELSQGQQKQYDKQFQEVQIAVSVTEEVDGFKKNEEEDGPEFSGLQACSVVITAATPMIEEAEKPFPPVEEEREEDELHEGKNKEESGEGGPVEEPPSYSQAVGEEEDQTVADSAPFPASSSTGSEEDTYTGPSTTENSQTTKRQEIPDELEPHQLARLQDLKESDA